MAAVLQNWLNSDMGLLCITLLSFPEAISSVPNISAKDKFKDVLITLLNKFPGILSEPSSIAQFSNIATISTRTRIPIDGI